MLAMLVLYRPPDDPEIFEKRYLEGHLPIVRAYEKLTDSVFLKTARVLQGEFPYAYVFRGFWETKDDWKADLNSETGARATADADEFAKGLYDVVVFDRLA